MVDIPGVWSKDPAILGRGEFVVRFLKGFLRFLESDEQRFYSLSARIIEVENDDFGD